MDEAAYGAMYVSNWAGEREMQGGRWVGIICAQLLQLASTYTNARTRTHPATYILSLTYITISSCSTTPHNAHIRTMNYPKCSSDICIHISMYIAGFCPHPHSRSLTLCSNQDFQGDLLAYCSPHPPEWNPIRTKEEEEKKRWID
jgi:hypothetical protein